MQKVRSSSILLESKSTFYLKVDVVEKETPFSKTASIKLPTMRSQVKRAKNSKLNLS
ncbi:hypothetical protein D3C86_2082410 [compost metagenome]